MVHSNFDEKGADINDLDRDQMSIVEIDTIDMETTDEVFDMQLDIDDEDDCDVMTIMYNLCARHIKSELEDAHEKYQDYIDDKCVQKKMK